MRSAEYWNRKYLQSPVLYEGRSLFLNNGMTIRQTVPIVIDVKHFIQTNDFFLERLVKDAGIWELDTDDEIAMACLRYVRQHIQYTPDKEQLGVNEFWMFPNETLALHRGDCEDGAILMVALMRNAGVPAHKIKVCAGFVVAGQNAPLGGHAYPIYLRESDEQWVALDWCIADNHNTFVNTVEGVKRFPKIKVGDVLPAYDEKTGKISTTEVKNISVRETDDLWKIEVQTSGKSTRKIVCTPEHPWFINGEWKQTKDIKEGDEIYFVAHQSFTNLFSEQRKEQYRRTSIRQTENNVFTRPDVRALLSIHNHLKRPEEVAKLYSARKARGMSQTEELFLNLCRSMNLPVIYVGDYSYWVNGKNPDFRVIGEKKVIDVTRWGFLGREQPWARARMESLEAEGHKAMIVFYDKRGQIMCDPTDVSRFVLNGKKVVKACKVRAKNTRQVWNLHCEPHNNYFVNGLLSHNCYLPNDRPIEQRVPVKDDPNYRDVWFTFNDEYSWSNQPVQIMKTIKVPPIKK